MLMFNNVPSVYLCRQFVDFRKSINGLSAIVEMQLELPATNGAVFVFCNKNRNKLKILYWDKTGFALWYKRLERERFKWPTQVDDDKLSLSEQQLHWLLQGHDVIGHRPVSINSCC